ncbi:hypothetical protein BABINDRAFT_161526 [Babjeviella inositovora NRRL Y-12698]|uniref:Uncharacterized protein n=1 Tax=Babjeviella inositovora NRRL Y-12698 TaxID=984486 RepID=A0A1E3QQ60_9ASCO|nr:uncharacterized protein BABINDRAFT_161526 [Babjeviella inositovora NRRL Y-12698]ODQ79846.1 hypothetical protein BABINDRAFT_161526 [Babjeviella inositovora NRRL Y-12698]
MHSWKRGLRHPPLKFHTIRLKSDAKREIPVINRPKSPFRYNSTKPLYEPNFRPALYRDVTEKLIPKKPKLPSPWEVTYSVKPDRKTPKSYVQDELPTPGPPVFSAPQPPSNTDRERMLQFILQSPLRVLNTPVPSAVPAAEEPAIWNEEEKIVLPTDGISTERVYMTPEVIEFIPWLDGQWLKHLLSQHGGPKTRIKLSPRCWFITEADQHVLKNVLWAISERQAYIKTHSLYINLKSQEELDRLTGDKIQLHTLYPLSRILEGVPQSHYAFTVRETSRKKSYLGYKLTLQVCSYDGSDTRKFEKQIRLMLAKHELELVLRHGKKKIYI